MTPYIITTGANGRCVIYGYSEEEPQPGQPFRLERARMVIRWTGQGIFGLAANGPRSADRISKAVKVTAGGPVKEVLHVSTEAATKLDEAPAWQG